MSAYSVTKITQTSPDEFDMVIKMFADGSDDDERRTLVFMNHVSASLFRLLSDVGTQIGSQEGIEAFAEDFKVILGKASEMAIASDNEKEYEAFDETAIEVMKNDL